MCCISSVLSLFFTCLRKLIFQICLVNKDTLFLFFWHSVFAFYLSLCALHLVSVTLLENHTHSRSLIKLYRGRQDTFYLSLLFSFTSPHHLRMSYHCPAGCNISVSDMRCSTSLNSCWLLLWAMLWGKAKLQAAESDSRGAADLLPPETVFGHETVLAVPTPKWASKHRYTCRVNTCTRSGFAITDTHSGNKMALAMHKAKQCFFFFAFFFFQGICHRSVVFDHACQQQLGGLSLFI